ncbi:MAG: Ig-like domain-containing protein, partial [Myxococcaceae bacterium]|nr:Ig-like domain-containing protein [Myxococcaceae bacterium]
MALASAALLLLTAPRAWAQSNPCSAPANAIVAENCLPGNPASEWDVQGSGADSIQGFATDISVNRGQTVSFKVKTDASNYRLDIYRMGFYGGLGARHVATVQPQAALPQLQPTCLSQPATGLVDCGNWAVSATWQVPANATSGIYFARLVREAGAAGASHIVFVVRDDDGASALLFQTSDTTWQAYNEYGGNSLYVGSPAGRAYKVSYNRPFTTRGTSSEDWVFNAEYPMVRWLEANGYDVSYTTGVDTDRRGGELTEHQVFLSVGHDEYWSGGQRANVEVARNAGVHLAFLSGNEVFWKTRWEASIDASGTPHRTLVCYKETHAGAKIDPLANVWTGTWMDPRPFNPEGPRPQNALSGTLFMVNCCTFAAMQVPAEEGKLRLWRNTSIANLAPGQTATLPPDTVAYEWDEDVDNGFRPPGLFRLSRTTVSNAQRLVDFGSTYSFGTATHSLTLYKHPSGALVFGAGTVQWSWGLDANHDRGSAAADVRMQQATVNLLADMGVQPGRLQDGLTPAAPSSDARAPTTTLGAPVAGATVPLGGSVTVSGTAADEGGMVGGVEVSMDDGATWHAAEGRGTWSFVWHPAVPGTAVLRARATDDSGNLGAASAPVAVTVAAVAGPVSVWNDTARPQLETANDGQA